MREFSNHAVLSMSNSTMAISSKYTQDLPFQIVSFTFFFFLMVSLFLLLGCNLSYIVDLFAGLPELASASARTLLKLASSVRALLKPYGDTLTHQSGSAHGWSGVWNGPKITEEKWPEHDSTRIFVCRACFLRDSIWEFLLLSLQNTAWLISTNPAVNRTQSN